MGYFLMRGLDDSNFETLTVSTIESGLLRAQQKIPDPQSPNTVVILAAEQR